MGYGEFVYRSAASRFFPVVKTTIFLADIGDFAGVNAVYAKCKMLSRKYGQLLSLVHSLW